MMRGIRPAALTAGLLGCTALTPPAFADCSQSGTTWTCTGSVSDILLYPDDGATTLQVSDLASSFGTAWLDWSMPDATGNGNDGAAATSVQIDFDGGSRGLTGSSAPYDYQAELEARSWAGAGSSGDHSHPAFGNAHSDPGGDGGDAGGATVNFTSGSVVVSPGASGQWSGIAAISTGGDGGPSDEAHAETGAAYGGAGGGGGAGGPASVVMQSGTISITAPTPQSAYGVLAQSAGGAGGAGAEAHSAEANSHSGPGGFGWKGGSASVEVDAGKISIDALSGSAIAAMSIGGDGGAAGEALSSHNGVSWGRDGDNGGLAGPVSVALGTGGVTISASGGASAITATSQGGWGGAGGFAHTERFGDSHGGGGSFAWDGGDVSLDLGTASITVHDSIGAVYAGSRGGGGGDGGEADSADGGVAYAGDAGSGGNAGNVTMTAKHGKASVRTLSASDVQHGIVLQSIAGIGGRGGDATAHLFGNAHAGAGGHGGTGGSVVADVWADVSTAGPQSQGLFVRSYGGAGGDGGNANAVVNHGQGGAGAGSGPAGAVTLSYRGALTTAGDEANALLAQSVGGFSGDGGDGSGFSGYGGGSQSAGDGGVVGVTLGSGATVTTSGASAYGVQVQSVGGGGGRGGSGLGITSLGASGSAGGSGGNVSVTIADGATVATTGATAMAAHAQSVGGGGGDGGGATGIFALGGSGGSGGSGGRVQITHAGGATTAGDGSVGLFAQSIGGGGGSAHTTDGVLSTIGGSGGAGGAGGPVTVDNASTVTTKGQDADAILLQSIGGGGGRGANAASISESFSTTIGGSGGPGMFANTVTYKDTGAAGRTISTQGDRARGVALQSIGGGGGHGGNAYSLSLPSETTASTTMGGSGGSGGDAFSALYESGVANITTAGDHAAAIDVQSIGGGGGSGGSSYALNTVSATSLSQTIGGSGAGGGNARYGSGVQSTGALKTSGDHSPGIIIQSIGGGGGHAGNAISTTGASALSLSPTIGGAGGRGGSGNSVSVTGGGGIVTSGALSPGIHAQSIGGGGGHGGTTASGAGVSGLNVSAAIGGSGGSGGVGNGVGVDWSDAITTGGDNSPGVLAQSVGGGGGSSGTTVAATLASPVAVNVAVGGRGGSGGVGGNAAAKTSGTVKTAGHISPGVEVQSIGGGGGHSGTTIAASGEAPLTVSPSIGGSGGDGGKAGTASATAASVTTSGNSSAAVVAQSVGGGGGSAHFTGALSGAGITANVAVGGAGGAGGDGGAVSATVSGALATSGHIAPGIKAMSIGGGGGDSGTTVAGSADSALAFNIAVGGNGGASGDGGAVAVTTGSGASIVTTGNLSSGIAAMSVARGGGSAGHVISASGISGANEGINVGGDGGDGGGGGYVHVENQAQSISTAGSFAGGIEASSVGGSGGSAKSDITASALSMANVSFTLGGGGGNGGEGGVVDVDNGGAISTGGPFAYGILAQSLGGSGGNGGLAAQASATGGEVSAEVGLTIGGSGGEGGSGGTVTVTSDRQISTDDFASVGILAQSGGGNGGAGGNVMTGNLNASTDGGAEVNVAIGGNGGKGATASTVSVTNYGGIATKGFLAEGIFAQSVGGNGGKGGSAYTMVTTAEGGSNIQIQATVGGSGGSGQHADKVTILNTGTITTAKGGSSAIVGQSIGGGGGKGGNAANLNINPMPEDTAGDDDSTSYNASVTVGVGGSGGSGGDGAAVEVTNSGSNATLTTEGVDAAGIYAQSIGGGGGEGGTTSSASFSFNGVCSALSGGAGYGCKAPKDPDDKSTTVKVSLTAEIGGKGGAAGNGDKVTVKSDTAISTAGDHSHGIMAHSVGGGGGNGGKGDLGIAAWTTNKTASWIAGLPGKFTFIPSPNAVSASVGGAGGASGHGGDVDIGGTGSIATKGRSSFGIFGQSIGGGGGNAAAGVGGLWTNLVVGGRGSGGGDGGAVTVSQSGAITTSGEGGIGIFAQSVGGGGGTAGDVEKGWTAPWADLNIGAGTGIQERPGGGGGGGAVSVTAGAITTTGVRAHGIVAQSVGGSGGIGAISGTASKDHVPQQNFAGGAGDAGDGGLVTVTTNGAISVTGASAHGIFAQSTTGRTGSQDKSAGVTINVNADIAATGASGRAILAHSGGGFVSQTGPIAITVAKGATVETGAGGWETIGIHDGNDNTIKNSGTIRNPGTAADAYVIRTNGIAPLAVQNSGVIEGSVLSQLPSTIATPDQGITITNAAGATFGFGPTMNLGNDGSITNAGGVSAGLFGTIGQSNVDGGFTQSAGGSMIVDFDVSGPIDHIDIDTAASLAGTVDPAPQGTLPKSGTSGRGTFLTADGFVGAGLTVANTATVNYALEESSTTVALTWDVDYAPWAGNVRSRAKMTDTAWGRLTGNHTRFAHHVDELIDLQRQDPRARSGRPGFVDDLVLFLLEVPEVEGLLDVYDAYAPPEIFAAADGMLFASQSFADVLMSCPDLGAGQGYVFRREGTCAWAGLGGSTSRRSGGGGYTEDVFALSGGAQAELTPGWFAGVALRYEHANLSGDGVGGDGDRFHLGAVVKHEIGDTTLSASLSGGFGSFDMSRPVITPGGVMTADSDPDGSWIAGHARVARSFDIGARSYVKPWLDVGVQHVRQGAFTESGAGDYGLRVDAVEQTLVSLAPTLELGTGLELFGAAAEATFSAGALAFVGDTDRSTSVGLVGVGPGGPRFTVTDGLDDTYATLGGALKVRLGARATLEADLGALVGEDHESLVGGAKLTIAF